MSDYVQILQQVSQFAYGVSEIARQIKGEPPAQPQQPVPTMQGDRAQWSQPYQPPASAPVAPLQAPAQGMGVMSTLRAMGSRLMDFLRRLFSPGASAPAAQPTTSWPAVNPDAREQLFAQFPTGRGTVLGFVSVEARREPDRLVLEASGFGGATFSRQNGTYVFAQDGKAPIRISQVTSERAPSGDTRFSISLESGKTIALDLLANGRSLRYDNRVVTLS
ncbi:hypothetical protein J7643_13655 [bacterium]|nr:hypothetical protein [bacterium]